MLSLWEAINNNAGGIQAVSTIVLVSTTIGYLRATRRLIHVNNLARIDPTKQGLQSNGTSIALYNAGPGAAIRVEVWARIYTKGSLLEDEEIRAHGPGTLEPGRPAAIYRWDQPINYLVPFRVVNQTVTGKRQDAYWGWPTPRYEYFRRLTESEYRRDTRAHKQKQKRERKSL